MERFQSWVALTALSLVIVGALFDELPEGGGGKARFALGTAFTSLILGAIFTAANLVDSLRNRLIGNAIENFVAILLMALWIIAIAFIQNPSNNIATAVENGMERIQYANLYFFSWLTFLSSVYTVGVTFRDNFQFGARFGQWMLLFTASIVLLATSVGAKDEICQYYAEKLQCERVKYATAVGAIGLVISALAVIMSVFDKMGHALEIGSTGLSFVLYIFGVFFLTSASGPAKVMGNMYFSLWGGCFISFALLIGVLFPNTAQDPTTQENHSGASPQEDHI